MMGRRMMGRRMGMRLWMILDVQKDLILLRYRAIKSKVGGVVPRERITLVFWPRADVNALSRKIHPDEGTRLL